MNLRFQGLQTAERKEVKIQKVMIYLLNVRPDDAAAKSTFLAKEPAGTVDFLVLSLPTLFKYLIAGMAAASTRRKQITQYKF